MRLVQIIDGSPVARSVSQVRRAFPNISFPAKINPDVLADFDIYPLVRTPKPDTAYNEVAVEGVSESNGVYSQTWTVAQRSPEEAQAIYDARQARLRLGVAGRMLASDFTQLVDAPLTDAQRAAWQTYRQELRGLWNADPFSFAWPVVPGPGVVKAEYSIRMHKFKDLAS